MAVCCAPDCAAHPSCCAMIPFAQKRSVLCYDVAVGGWEWGKAALKRIKHRTNKEGHS